jgi:hypothetical protein
VSDEEICETLARFPCVDAVFGNILRARLWGHHESFILDLLAQKNDRVLAWWNHCCCRYRAIISNVESALAGLDDDLRRIAQTSGPSIFDGRLKDALAEVCAVVELFSRGASGFERIAPPRGQGHKAPDFRCFINNDAGQPEVWHVEVKNFRAPIGIVDVLKTLYDERAKSNPEILNRRIEVSHYWDNTVTEEQRRAIETLFDRISTCPLPFDTILRIDDEDKQIEVDVRVREGMGVKGIRGIGGEKPWGPFTKQDKFIAHAEEKILKGVNQLKAWSDRNLLLVLNIESPDAMVESDLLLKLRDIADIQSGGNVEVRFLLFYHWVE